MSASIACRSLPLFSQPLILTLFPCPPAVCQALRITTFTVTQLPGPSFHCREGEATATRPWPDHWTGHVVVDVQRAAAKSCGDLIFSSHTTFMLTGVLSGAQHTSCREGRDTTRIVA